MPLSNASKSALLSEMFTAVATPWDAATQLDVHLHTADPGAAGNSTTNEATYTGYAVVVSQRSATDWTVTGTNVTNDLLMQFPICTAGSNAITHASITAAGSTLILRSAALPSTLNVSTSIQPQINPGDIDFLT